jgi:hypothetical protein
MEADGAQIAGSGAWAQRRTGDMASAPGNRSRRGPREEGKEMKIDTEIRHVTKPGANLFLELGFTPDEAKRLQAASGKQINDTRLLKQQRGRAVCLDCGTSLKAGRGRRDFDGLGNARPN